MTDNQYALWSFFLIIAGNLVCWFLIKIWNENDLHKKHSLAWSYLKYENEELVEKRRDLISHGLNAKVMREIEAINLALQMRVLLIEKRYI